LLLLIDFSNVSFLPSLIMQFQVTDIEFAFDDGIGIFPIEDQQEIVDETLSTTWEACDEDDLIEEITCATGWCINSIDYVHVLK